MYDFYKNFIFLGKNIFFFQIKLCIQNKYLYPLSKNLILLKKSHSVKIFILFKQTHSVKDESYFQLSFATNEQVKMIVKKNKSIFFRFCKIETFKPLYKLCQIKSDKERSYFSLRTMFCKCLLPMLQCV